MRPSSHASCESLHANAPRPQNHLPIVVLLVAEPDEQPPGYVFEDLLVSRAEDVLPVARHALPEEGGGVLLASPPTLRELLEAGRVHAVSDGLFTRFGPEEPEQARHLLF